MIDPQDPFKRKTTLLLGRRMAYVDEGTGPVVLLLHGNATYSYYWRNLIRYLATTHRCIAPDYFGMGDSELRYPSGPSTYTYRERAMELQILLEILVPRQDVVLIGHELGGLHALDLAHSMPQRVRGIVLIEAAVEFANMELWDREIRDLVRLLRTPEGEDLALRDNVIIERYLPALTSRQYSSVEMDRYRAPFAMAGEPRRAPLTMIRELPLLNEPGPIDQTMEVLRHWAAEVEIPKLLIRGSPGHIMIPAPRSAYFNWRMTDVMTVNGRHFLLEESPTRIAATAIDWIKELPPVPS